MASHCRCCSGKFIEDDVLGDCPGCPECADRDAQLYRLGEELAEARLEIAKLTATLEAAHEDVRALAEDLQMAQGQWGNDYLWQKWGCGESLYRPTVRKIVEGT